MAVNQNIINKLRQKKAIKVVYILQLLRNDNTIIYNLCNADEDITSNGITYLRFPFDVEADEFSSIPDYTLTLIFENFSVRSIDRKMLDQIKRVRVGMIDVDFKDEPILPLRVLEFKSRSIVAGKRSYVVGPIEIQNKKFPYRVFNSKDHPELYETFGE